jgi:hypothetical protein
VGEGAFRGNVSIPRLIGTALILCAVGGGWSWLDRLGGGSRERWQMRLLIIVFALALLLPVLGYDHIAISGAGHAPTKAQKEASSELDAP